MEDTENTTITPEQKSSVKIVKNTKGYNWEVKVYDDDIDKAFEATNRIEKKCQDTYGVKTE